MGRLHEGLVGEPLAVHPFFKGLVLEAVTVRVVRVLSDHLINCANRQSASAMDGLAFSFEVYRCTPVDHDGGIRKRTQKEP